MISLMGLNMSVRTARHGDDVDVHGRDGEGEDGSRDGEGSIRVVDIGLGLGRRDPVSGKPEDNEGECRDNRWFMASVSQPTHGPGMVAQHSLRTMTRVACNQWANMLAFEWNGARRELCHEAGIDTRVLVKGEPDVPPLCARTKPLNAWSSQLWLSDP